MKKIKGLDTELVHAGRNPQDYYGVVNPPITKTSTIILKSLEDFEDRSIPLRYGCMGTPMSYAIEEAITKLENGFNAVTVGTGLVAVSSAILSFAKAGDHILVADGLYHPTRQFCDNVMKRMGCEIEYYDPVIGSGIEEKIKENTSIIYLESPASATFEIQDIPAIAKVARNKNVITIMDNTWASGILFKPLDHGVDVSLISCTKYIAGYADAFLGVIVAASEEHYKKLRQTTWDLGVHGAPDDIYACLRGLRTLTLRLEKAEQQATALAQWMESRPEVERVFYPALESHNTHDLWKRDFTGANGIFSVLFNPVQKEKYRDFIHMLELFKLGYSWGSYLSLVLPQPLNLRKSMQPIEKGRFLRFQVGFEDIEDLKEDLEQALKKLA